MYDIYISYHLNAAETATVTTEELFYSIPIVNSANVVKDPVVSCEMGKSGSFEFSIYPTHPFYNRFQQMKTVMRVSYSGTDIFRGRVLTIDTNNMTGVRKIHLEGDLAFLMDSYLEGVTNSQKTTMSVYEYLQKIINNHNSQMNVSGSTHKKFYLGEVPGHYSNDIKAMQRILVSNGKFGDTGWRRTSDAINGLVKDHGGCLRTRRVVENGVEKIYLDWLETCYNSVTNSQQIEIKKNLIDMSGTSEVDNLFTVLIPIGSKNGNHIYIDGYNTQYHGNNKSITVRQVYDYLVAQGRSSEMQKGFHRPEDYRDAVDNYGIIYKTQNFDAEDTKQKLWDTAIKWVLSNYNGGITSFNVTALDLHHVNENEIEKYLVGDLVYVSYPQMEHHTDGDTPVARTRLLTVTSAKYNLHNPESNSYVIGIPNSLLSKAYTKRSDKKATSKKNPSSNDPPDDPKSESDKIAEHERVAWRFIINEQYNNEEYKELERENPKAAEAALKLSYAAIVRGLTAIEDPNGQFSEEYSNKVTAATINPNAGILSIFGERAPAANEQAQQFADSANNMAENIVYNWVSNELSVQEKLDFNKGPLTDEALTNYILHYGTNKKKSTVTIIPTQIPYQEKVLSSLNLKSSQIIPGTATSTDPLGALTSTSTVSTNIETATGSIDSLKSGVGIGDANTILPTIKNDGFDAITKYLDPTNAGSTDENDTTVEIKGSDGGQSKYGRASNNDWRIKVNTPVTYTDSSGQSHTLEPGFVTAEDFKIFKEGISNNIPSLRSKLIVVDTLLADAVYTNDLTAINAFIQNLQGDSAKIERITAKKIYASQFVSAGDRVSAPSFQLSTNGDIAYLENCISDVIISPNGGRIEFTFYKIGGGSLPTKNFNIADTQFYKDAVDSAKSGVSIGAIIYTPASGETADRTLNPGQWAKAQGTYTDQNGQTQTTTAYKLIKARDLVVQDKGTQYATNSTQTFTPDSGYDGISSIRIGAVMVSGLTAANIKKNVVVNIGDSADADRIASVTGEYEPSLEDKGTQYATNSTQTFTPSSGYDGISSIKIGAVTMSGLTAANIKKNVVVNIGDSADADRIASVTGTYEPSLEDKGTQYATNSTQTFTPSSGYDGISSIKIGAVTMSGLTAANIKKDVVVKIGDSADADRIASVTGTYEPSLEDKGTQYATTSTQTFTPSSGYDGISSIKIGAVTMSGLTAANIKKDVVVKIGDSADADRIASVTGEYEPSLEDKGTQYATTSTQTFTPSSGYDGISSIKIGAVTMSGLTAANIKKDVVVKIGDSADADRIASVTGEYEPSLEDKGTHYATTSTQTFTPSSGYDGISSIKIGAVTTSGLTAANIKKDVVVNIGDSADADRIASVTGTYEPSLENKGTQYATTSTQTFTPSSGYDGISSIKIGAVTMSGLTAANIKKDVVVKIGDSADADRIASVTGEYEPSLEDKGTQYATNSTQTFTPSSGYDGISSIKIGAVTMSGLTAANIKKDIVVNIGDSADADRIASVTGTYEPSLEDKGTQYATTSTQTFTPSSGYDGISSIKIGAVTMSGLTAANIKKDVVVNIGDSADADRIASVTGTYEPSLENKGTQYATTSTQTFTPSSGYDGISSIKIGAVTMSGLTAANIKKDVVVNIGDSADADRIASVTGTYEPSLENKGTQYATTSTQTFTPSSGYDGISSIKIGAVTTSGLTAANIKKDVVVKIGDSADADRIASVTGTYEPSLENKGTQYATTSTQTFTPSSGYDGISSIKIGAVTMSGLTAANIKKDVVVKIGDSADADRIASVTGSYTPVASFAQGNTTTLTAKVEGISGSSAEAHIARDGNVVYVTDTVAYTQGTSEVYAKYTMLKHEAETWNTNENDQIIYGGRFLTGDQTIKAVTTSGISPENIKRGVTILVGDANSPGRIKNVNGEYDGADYDTAYNAGMQYQRVSVVPFVGASATTPYNSRITGNLTQNKTYYLCAAVRKSKTEGYQGGTYDSEHYASAVSFTVKVPSSTPSITVSGLSIQSSASGTSKGTISATTVNNSRGKYLTWTVNSNTYYVLIQ